MKRHDKHLLFLKKIAFVLITLMCLLNLSVSAQRISAADRNRLRRAEQSADEFVRRFSETLDFSVVWKEFRSNNVSSLMLSSFTSESNFTSANEVDEKLIERGFVALMKYVYLKAAFDLGTAKTGSDASEEEFTPNEITKLESANKYIKTNGEEPQNAKEIEEFIVEADNLAKLYRKYVSQDTFKSSTYKKNLREIAEFYAPDKDKYRVVKDESESGLGANVKQYRVTRGAFHYAFIEENGKMKIIGIGTGN